MSQNEFQPVKVIENAGERLSVREAFRLPQLSERQLQRLRAVIGPIPSARFSTGITHAHAVGGSLPQERLILELARGKYPGFNDFHLAENPRKGPPSAARLGAASCRRNWLLRRSTGLVNTAAADRPAHASA
jgi:hypothetical protein